MQFTDVNMEAYLKRLKVCEILNACVEMSVKGDNVKDDNVKDKQMSGQTDKE